MNNKGMGALKSPKDLRNYKISSKATAALELPLSFELKYSHIKDQGNVCSCVAHSLSEVLEAKDGINYSTGWIYGYRPEDYYQGYGMYTNEALKTIKNVGYLINDELNTNKEMNEAKQIVDKDLVKYKTIAENKKISAYARLNSINEIKQALYLNKTPIIICFEVSPNGLQLNENFIAEIPTTDSNINDGHATVCYGWNENGLLIQNSWGENWGNKGTFIMPYNYPWYEAWLISFEKEKQEEKLEIVKPNYYLIRKIIMKITNFIWKLFNKKN